ncbi:hypothetical protein QBC33DRAFT_455591 [Phialemonium atrogriseum]|uniref:FAD/NAD(P)-binding domain-containing protein n=1 Tax=Phialemonium atrogriseum TaxID=1093897 RepID=A0AAJ0FLQ1_9PEZI|nr:uncharacterized protein QBC33DRAFT_455591 [Phialemonium atrogriseum]KAK1765315.1 hypothetical protein QBC33DRAFT_455591 [Phialemonium atrogriseum]
MSATPYGRYPCFDSSQRPLHVLVSGAGPSGIAMAIELKKLPNVTFHVFEKNRDVGGTWLENRYPGAACDIASHAYQYTFQSKTDWSTHFAPADEIGQYFTSVAKTYDIYPFISFNSRVVSAKWHEERAKWQLEVASVLDDSKPETFEGDVFINAGGVLNDWKWPDIEGLGNFQGNLIHTAAWDDKVDLTDKSVAIIGSGATSVQVVPSIQPAAKQLTVYVRSPTYILPTVGFGVESSTFNEHYSESQIQRFASDPAYYKEFRKGIEQQMNENFIASVKSSKEQAEGRKWAETMMRQAIGSPELQEKLIPSWELGCRRLTPGRPYLDAVQKANVDIIRTAIKRVTKIGIETIDGQVHEADIIVCATGFNTSFSSRYDITGRHGCSLRSLWQNRGPEAYLGLAIAGLPNYFTLLGPNCPIANGSLIPCIEWSVQYIIQALLKIQTEQIKTLDVKKAMQIHFNEYAQNVHQDLVWTGQCNSWYKDKASGRVTAVWPGSSIHYMEMTRSPRWEDYDIEYVHPNPFMFMGNGISQREAKNEDLTFCKRH